MCKNIIDLSKSDDDASDSLETGIPNIQRKLRNVDLQAELPAAHPCFSQASFLRVDQHHHSHNSYQGKSTPSAEPHRLISQTISPYPVLPKNVNNRLKTSLGQVNVQSMQNNTTYGAKKRTLDTTEAQHGKKQRLHKELPLRTNNIIQLDDEDDDLHAMTYQQHVTNARRLEREYALIPRQSSNEDENGEDENGDDDEDVIETTEIEAPFYNAPLPLQRNGDGEVIEIATRVTRISNIDVEPRRANPSLSSFGQTGTREIPKYKANGYNCAPGKCVELKDGSFMRITRVMQDQRGTVSISGHSFVRQNDFPRTKWPRRHNELVQMVQVQEAVSTEVITMSIDQVTKNRHLILTNQSFPRMSSRDHRDASSFVFRDMEFGPLFCRWKQTVILDRKGKPVEEIIEKILYAAADPEGGRDDWRVRMSWQKATPATGGEYFSHTNQLSANGQAVNDPRTKQQYTFGDTFCGAGGASSGASQAGLRVMFGVDMDEKAMRTYAMNFAPSGTKCVLQDIHDFIAKAVPGQQRVDVLHISPPCQPFSPAHTVFSEWKDELNQAALFSVGELLDLLKPRVVTLEETFGLPSRHEKWFHALVRMFLDRGYSIRSKITGLEGYGLPQTRKRLIIIAAGPGDALPRFPEVTHSATDSRLRRLVTIHDMIEPLSGETDITHHAIQAAKPRKGMSKIPYSAHTQAKTITTSGGIGNYHPSGERNYTMRELAALQRFPTTFKFADVGVTSLRKQIGNACPPFVFKRIYRKIIESLKKTDGIL